MKAASVVLVFFLLAGVQVFAHPQDEKDRVKDQMVTVPKVTEILSGQARKAVTGAGLVYELAPQGQPTSDPNKNAFVYKQSPDAGTRVMRGSKVIATIYVFQEKK